MVNSTITMDEITKEQYLNFMLTNKELQPHISWWIRLTEAERIILNMNYGGEESDAEQIKRIYNNEKLKT